MAYKPNWDKMWRGFKYYRKHFKTRKEEFMYRLHHWNTYNQDLQQLLDKFPQHKWKNEMLAELERRKNASKWKRSERLTRIRNAENKLLLCLEQKARFKHYYLHQTPKQELIDYLNKGQKPKLKVKALRELERRGVKIVWTYTIVLVLMFLLYMYFDDDGGYK